MANSLNGCMKDAHDIVDVVCDPLGFSLRQITVLTEGCLGRRQPGRTMEGARWLLDLH